ncbi:hypothetical protein [uncultured Parabacteroides sp.]|uniref:lipopolysaccharide biosynthesis protein n=1 Tax=uncultured Parabacteroides sp. TaxID=512312 RepID=UPI0025961EE2|nr:hypothetical protein [uncultured Parabacteroides sp.]
MKLAERIEFRKMANNINHKRIVVNTVFLYIRQIVTMIISLMATGIVMRELGIEDYGTYNVVGGVVALLSILQGVMAVGTQRFLNYEMGRGNTVGVRDVFNLSLLIYFAIAAIVVLIAETVGLWYVCEKMVIPEGRMTAVLWVYQFSILASVLSVTQTPYTAVIIANEKMKVFGWLGIAESLSRFLLILLLPILPFDKLISFGVINLSAGIFYRLVYRVYCKRSFPECKFIMPHNPKLLKEIASFSGWSLLAKIAYVGRDQGGAIVVNSFFGVALNASVAVATNVNSIISSFVSNFQTAYRPQLVKAYAANDIKGMMFLFYLSSRISAFLILLFSIPVVANIDYLLQLWLGVIPEKSALIISILLLDSFVSALFAPFWMTIFAMGNIKKYQLAEGLIVLMNIPLMFFAFSDGLEIEWMYIIRIFLVGLLFAYAIVYLVKEIDFPILQYTKIIVLPISIVAVLSFIGTIYISSYFGGFFKICISIAAHTILFLPLFYTIVLTPKEKMQVVNLLLNKIRRIK